MGNTVTSIAHLASSMAAESLAREAAMAVLKKSNDLAKDQGAALMQLLEASLPETGPPETGPRILDLYA